MCDLMLTHMDTQISCNFARPFSSLCSSMQCLSQVCSHKPPHKVDTPSIKCIVTCQKVTHCGKSHTILTQLGLLTLRGLLPASIGNLKPINKLKAIKAWKLQANVGAYIQQQKITKNNCVLHCNYACMHAFNCIDITVSYIVKITSHYISL